MPVDRAGHSFRASRRGLRQCYLATLPFFSLRPTDTPAELQRRADPVPKRTSLAPLGRMLVKAFAGDRPAVLVELALRLFEAVGWVIDRPLVAKRLTLRRVLKRPDGIEPDVVWDIPFEIAQVRDLRAVKGDFVRITGSIALPRTTLESDFPCYVRLFFMRPDREISKPKRRRRVNDLHKV